MGLDVASSERELMRTCQHVNKGENKSNAFIMLVTTVISLCSKVNISLTLKNIQMDQFVKFTDFKFDEFVVYPVLVALIHS